MSESTEKIVLMKCSHCKHEEKAPRWILEELNEFTSDKTYQMICPKCDRTMYEKESKS